MNAVFYIVIIFFNWLDFGYYQLMNSDECVMSSLGQSEVEQYILDQCEDPDNAMTYLQSKG